MLQLRTRVVVSNNGELGAAGESSPAVRLAVACCTADK